MTKYTNQQLTSVEVIAELVELAKEVAEEANQGQKFTPPPMDNDELVFYDAVALNESASQQGEDMLATIARQLSQAMRVRCVPTGPSARTSVPNCVHP